MTKVAALPNSLNFVSELMWTNQMEGWQERETKKAGGD